MSWILKPAFDVDSDQVASGNTQTEADFFIQLDYGERPPRLVSREEKRLIATMDNYEDQYDGPCWSRWTLRLTKKDSVQQRSIIDYPEQLQCLT